MAFTEKMAHMAQAQAEWLELIAQCLEQDYASVEKDCIAICAMSPAPALDTLNLICDLVFAGVTLQQIHDDYASGQITLRRLQQLAGWWL